MKKRFHSPVAVLLFAFLLTSLPVSKKKIRVWLIGDSTMAHYDMSRAPLTGWGTPFSHFFDSTVTVENKARGGRSTRTFISEGLWQQVADNLQAGDYVFMQFGHNDEAKEEKYKDRYTPVPDYIRNLEKFVLESRTRQALPVILTPVTRMRFNTQGIQEETHKEYTAAAMETGARLNVPVIDLDAASRNLLQELGPVFSKRLFMQLDSLEHPNYPAGQKDNTHFNEFGARLMAQLVLAEVRKKIPELSDRISSPVKNKPR